MSSLRKRPSSVGSPPPSCLQRAAQAKVVDGRFVLLWFAFNAAYATDIDETQRLASEYRHLPTLSYR
ncbi:hypothetical protein EQV93_17185 [Pseudomonas sp. TMW22091]|nr:hypothetical protein [Pseudomonas sp. TMW22091]